MFPIKYRKEPLHKVLETHPPADLMQLKGHLLKRLTMSDKEERVVLGNEAIARGVVESGCQFFAAYPGTPSSEILPAIVRFKKENNLDSGRF